MAKFKVMDFELSTVKNIVEGSQSDFLNDDHALIKAGVSEWTFCHRLAVYIEKRFFVLYPDLLSVISVDCEYNRDIKEVKRWGTGKFQFRPDIAVHERMERNNIFVIELKKSDNIEGPTVDHGKLRFLTNPNERFKYQYGIFILFDVEISRFSCTWFAKGDVL